MAFQFSLQEVQDYRDQIVQQHQRAVAQVQNEIERIENLLVQVEKMRVQYRKEMDTKMNDSDFTAAHRDVYIQYIRGIEDLSQRSRAHLKDLELLLAHRRKILTQAAQELQVMDELKKVEHRKFIQVENRLEAKLYDEIAIRKYLTQSEEKFSELGQEVAK